MRAKACIHPLMVVGAFSNRNKYCRFAVGRNFSYESGARPTDNQITKRKSISELIGIHKRGCEIAFPSYFNSHLSGFAFYFFKMALACLMNNLIIRQQFGQNIYHGIIDYFGSLAAAKIKIVFLEEVNPSFSLSISGFPSVTSKRIGLPTKAVLFPGKYASAPG